MYKEEILGFVRESIKSLDENKKLSDVIRSCIRIARLREDYSNLLWLQLEMINIQNNLERKRIQDEIKPHFVDKEFNYLNKNYFEMWMKERPAISVSEKGEIDYPQDSMIAYSVIDIENELESLQKTLNSLVTPHGLHHQDLYIVDRDNRVIRTVTLARIRHYDSMLNNIKNRVYDFLSLAEKQLLYGQYHSDFFEQNRLFVEKRMAELCPDALKEFVASISNNDEKTPEVWAQKLVSCRRMLKDLANFLYPAREGPVKGSDGKERDLNEENYINRLWQFVSDSFERRTSGGLLKTAIQDLGNRTDYLYELSSKGVHDDVGEFEVNQCLIQTYILAGDLLRIYDKTSAIGLEEEVK